LYPDSSSAKIFSDVIKKSAELILPNIKFSFKYLINGEKKVSVFDFSSFESTRVALMEIFACIEILQDRLALEQGKAASLKTAVNKLNRELKYTTSGLLSILNDEHVKSKTLSQKVTDAEETRLEEMKKYNERIKLIKDAIEQIQEINLSQMISKIDYQARESIWLVSQLNRPMRDKKILMAK
jgi:hypothetical protein